MTVQAIATPESYVGNGVTTLFPVNFNFFLPNDLLVTLVDTTSGSPVTSTLVLNGTPGYSVAGGLSAVTGLSGNGSITTSWAPTAYQTIIISPNFALTQQTHYVPNSPFPAASHENALDRLTLIAQQQAVALGECIQAPVGVLGFTGTFPFITPSVYGFSLGLNANGTGLAWIANGNAQQLTQLGDTTNPANGSGMIGYNPALAYAAGTVGYTLKNALTAVAAYIVGQTGNSFTTTGTGAAYIGTPASPATNAAGQRVNATFALAGTGSPTLAVSGLAALPLVAYNSAGVLVAYQPYLGQVADVQCNGTQWIVLEPITKSTTSGGRFKNLIVAYGQSSGMVAITADEVTVEDTVGNQTRLSTVNTSATLATVGAIGGTDGSTLTAGNMYTVWIAYNPATQAVGALISAESPTIPTDALLGPVTPVSGYTQYALVSINKIKALAPAYWQPAIQTGSELRFTVGSYLTAMPTICSGILGSPTTPTWQAETVRGNGALVPYHASKIQGLVAITSGSTSDIFAIAPNASYGVYNGANPPPFTSGYFGSNYFTPPVYYDMLLEANTVQVYSATSGTTWFLYGYTLNL